MKPGWSVQALASLAEVFTDGDWIESKDQSDRGIRLVQTGNIGEGVFKDRESKARYIDEETFDRLRCSEIVPGDCLISRLPDPVGRACLIPETGQKMITAVDCSIVRFKSGLMSPEFFVYFSQSQEYLSAVSQACTGTTRSRISRSNLGQIAVPLPPLDEQRRIVTLLDEAFEGLARARENAEANLQNARELFTGTIHAEFAWIASAPKRKVGDVAVHALGKMLDKNKNKGTPRLYLRNLNVRWFNVDTSDLLEMRITDTEVERYTVKKGDLLICEGGYPGRCAIWNDGDEMFFQKALHRVRFEHSVHGRLLMYFLFMADQNGTLREHFSGAGIQHFTGQALAKFEMPFPSEAVAMGVISKIEAMQQRSLELESMLQQKLRDLDDLRQSLLQKAFAGGLT